MKARPPVGTMVISTVDRGPESKRIPKGAIGVVTCWEQDTSWFFVDFSPYNSSRCINDNYEVLDENYMPS